MKITVVMLICILLLLASWAFGEAQRGKVRTIVVKDVAGQCWVVQPDAWFTTARVGYTVDFLPVGCPR
jgi:hypothetical protein